MKEDREGAPGERFPDSDYLDADDIDEGTEFMQQNACDDFSNQAENGESSPKGKKGRRS